MPERFPARWLRLREPVDHEARDDALAVTLAGILPRERRVHVVDLGAGGGSNLRYLGPRLPQTQHWTLVDHDAALLEQALAGRGIAASGAERPRVEASALRSNLEDFPDGLPASPDLLTGSALLDLVSADWLQRVVECCCRWGIPALFALSVDGRLAFDPSLPGDDLVDAAIGAHQQRHKDMGPALGPEATDVAAGLFAARGARVMCRHSDWWLDPEQAALQRALLEGWHSAAREQRPDAAADIDRWLDDRLRALTRSHIQVGHQDLLAIPCQD